MCSQPFRVTNVCARQQRTCSCAPANQQVETPPFHQSKLRQVSDVTTKGVQYAHEQSLLRDDVLTQCKQGGCEECDKQKVGQERRPFNQL